MLCNAAPYHTFVKIEKERGPRPTYYVYIFMERVTDTLVNVVYNLEKTTEVTLDLFEQLLEHLICFEKYGISHCDLKPGNIMVKDDKLCIIDYTAEIDDGNGGTLGRMEHFRVGTPTYSAPEVWGVDE